MSNTVIIFMPCSNAELDKIKKIHPNYTLLLLIVPVDGDISYIVNNHPKYIYIHNTLRVVLSLFANTLKESIPDVEIRFYHSKLNTDEIYFLTL